MEAALPVSCRSVGLLYQLLTCSSPYALRAKGAGIRKGGGGNGVHSHPPGLSGGTAGATVPPERIGLYAAFQAAVGRTPIQIKHKILVEEAVDLLTATDLSVEAVSSFLGFSSTAYFRKILRRETGKTP